LLSVLTEASLGRMDDEAILGWAAGRRRTRPAASRVLALRVSRARHRAVRNLALTFAHPGKYSLSSKTKQRTLILHQSQELR
jgi:hypothetical protein